MSNLIPVPLNSIIMDDVVTLVLWLITTPARIVYFPCLVSVTFINIHWIKKGNILERHNTLLLIAGVPWLWSNMGVGFVGLLICSISLSIHGSCSWKALMDSGFRDVDLDSNKERYWIIFRQVGCLSQSILGVVWLWSNFELGLHLALFAFVIYGIAYVFQGNGVLRYCFKKSKVAVFFYATIFGTVIASLLLNALVLLILATPFKAACNFFKIIWRGVCGSMLPFRSASEVSISSTTISTHLDNEEDTLSSSSIGSEFSTTRSSWQATIGQNVNQGGTQTIGSIRIGEYVLQIQATAGRDIIFNTTMIRERNRDF